MSSRSLLVAGVLASSLLASGCGVVNGRSRASDNLGGQLITAEVIRTSGLSTGWDVLRRFGNHLTLDEKGGEPVRVARRGRESVYLAESPLLIVDGVKVRNFRILTTLPARDIESMRILSAMESNVRYGMQAASGAIIVQTLQPDPAGPADTVGEALKIGR